MCRSVYTHKHTHTHPFLHASVLLVLCQIQLRQTLRQEPIKTVALLSQTLVKQWDLSAKAYGISLADSFIYLIRHHYESPSTHAAAELIKH